jgi:hypothetical protein
LGKINGKYKISSIGSVLKRLKEYFGDYYLTSTKEEGSGFKRNKKLRKRIIRGKGKNNIQLVREVYVNDGHENNNISLPNKNLYLDGNKLFNHNIVSIRYKSNKQIHPNLRQTRVTENCSKVLQDIVKNKYDERFMKLLNSNEREIVKHFLQICKFPIEINKEESKRFNQEFEILKGEILAGNDNVQLKKKLKDFVIYGMKTNKIKRNEAMEILLHLS